MNGAERIRKDLLIHVVRAFSQGQLDDTIDRIPTVLRPKNGGFSRCCIYHDRAVLRHRIMALLGISLEGVEDELKPLSAYLKDALAQGLSREGAPLTVSDAGCSGCPDSRYIVTSDCRGCFSRPCMFNCPKNAISVDQRAIIDYSRCVRCGKCERVCPFKAVMKTIVPCVNACPVGAIRKNNVGVAEIDFEKCIFCGQCLHACPFGAIMERSQVIQVLESLRQGEKLVAMVAPAAFNQFPGTRGRMFQALRRVGFEDVMEVALGADDTTCAEAQEFAHKVIHGGQRLLTTSCCPAFVELAKKHVPDILPFVSATPSPMRFTAKRAKERHPSAKVVFIGPCIAKRYEATLHGDEVDAVLTFEELSGILEGLNISIQAQDELAQTDSASENARNFCRSFGVTEAVLTRLQDAIPEFSHFKLVAQSVSGIDQRGVKTIKGFANGTMSGNFLEVMACHEGCIGGPCSLKR